MLNKIKNHFIAEEEGYSIMLSLAVFGLTVWVLSFFDVFDLEARSIEAQNILQGFAVAGGMITRDKFRKKAIKQGMMVLKQRNRNRTLKSEADFLSGAMSMLALVNMEFYGSSYDDSMGLVPPAWVFTPMSGRSLLDEDDDES